MECKTKKKLFLIIIFFIGVLSPLEYAYSHTVCRGVPIEVISSGSTYHGFDNGGATGDVVAILFDEGQCNYGSSPKTGKVWAIIDDISEYPSAKKKFWSNIALVAPLTQKGIEISARNSTGKTRNGYPIIKIYMMKMATDP